ncbi:DHS-like NAD/FAD-binding domain-containing protein [Crassisporium funariophilum]|nr:DHS-like NAD/FAD-binding domain-containing protein [Crassisporium funariophilum]
MSYGQRHRRVHSGKPKVLKSRDVPSIAEYIKSKECKNIILMLGAGVSTSAGIPDFRSPETGLYSNLARLNLPHPEAVFEIGFFRRNPVPFYTLAHELYPGKFRPTITHSFVRLLAEQSLLHTCFTQNIDTLERRAGVPDNKVIEAHGSFASQKCIDCEEPFDDEDMKKHIQEKKIAKCPECGGLVKPDIVFFGEGLPLNFIRSVPNMRKADLLIVMGTSLTVHPFASLAGMVESNCPRVLINLDHVGDFGARADDVILLGKCDEIVTQLCKELGWEEELLRLWKETEDAVVSDDQGDLKNVAPADSSASASDDQKVPDKLDHLKDVTAKMAALTVAAATSTSTSSGAALKPEPVKEDKASPLASVPSATPESLSLGPQSSSPLNPVDVKIPDSPPKKEDNKL